MLLRGLTSDRCLGVLEWLSASFLMRKWALSITESCAPFFNKIVARYVVLSHNGVVDTDRNPAKGVLMSEDYSSLSP
jgi:hypothetical protein